MPKVPSVVLSALLCAASFSAPLRLRAQTGPEWTSALSADQLADLNVVALSPATTPVRTGVLAVTITALGPAAPGAGVVAVWNGVDEFAAFPSSVVSNTYIATIDAAKFTTVGTFPIALKTTGGVLNAAKNFVVTNVAPTISAVLINPNPARAGEPFGVTITGNEFNSNAVTTVNGVPCTPVTTIPTQITCNILATTPANTVSTLGKLNVQVTNPGATGVAALNSGVNNDAEMIHGPPAKVDFTPLNPSVASAANQVFTISSIRDRYDNEIALAGERGINWSLSASTGTNFTIVSETAAQFTVKVATLAGPYANVIRADSTAANKKATAFKETSVTVTAGAIDRIVVTPGSKTLVAGTDQQQFTAIAYDAGNNPIPGAVFTWAAGQGTITAAGLHTAGPTVGIYNVTASSGGVNGIAQVTIVPGPAVRAEFIPPNATVAVTAQALFTLTGYDAYDNPTTVNNVAFSSSSAGSVTKLSDTQVRFTAGTVANVFPTAVRAISGTINIVAPITITPGAIDRVIVTPGGVTILPQPPGNKVTFTAKAQDQYGNEILGRTFTWAKNGLPGAAVLTPINATKQAELTLLTVAGDYVDGIKVTDNASGKVGSASIVVTPDTINSITLTPANPTTTPGGRVTFTAVARDSSNNVVSAAFSWDVGAAGVIESSGINTITLRATNAVGVYANSIEAAVAGKIATTGVTVNPGAISRVTITPNPGLLGLNSNAQFTAALLDAAGNTINAAPNKFTWSVSGPLTLAATSGNPITLNSGQSAGIFVNALSVTHTDSGKSSSITVTVQPAQLTALRITPDAATVAADATQTFSVVGIDQFGNTINGLSGIAWSTTNGAGTISAAGLFRASRTAGSYPSSVVAAVGPISTSAAVTVTPGALNTLEITNNPIIAAGTQRTYVAVGRDSFGNAIPNLPVTWSANAGGALVASGPTSATFRAGFALGTFNNALSASAQGKSAVLNITVAGATITVTAPSTRLNTDGRSVLTVTATVRDILSNATIEDGTPITLTISSCSGSCELLRNPTDTAGQPQVVGLTARNGSVTFFIRSRNNLPPSGILGPTQSTPGIKADFANTSATLLLQGRFEPYRNRLGSTGRDTPNANNNNAACQARRFALPAYISQLANTSFNIYRVTLQGTALSLTLRGHPSTGQVYLYRVRADTCATNNLLTLEPLRAATTSGGSLQVTFAGLAPQSDYLVAVFTRGEELKPVAYSLEIRAE
jgi:hypothetical protein